MAITVENWSRRVELTGLTPASSLTNFVALITEANLPTEIWGLAENGGGDIRACLDAEGTNQLPIEIVTFNTLTEKALIFVRLPNYTSTVKSLWLFYGKAGESQPAVAASFGRNAVWVDYFLVLHGINNADDSSGNGVATVYGTPTYSEAGIRLPVGSYLQFDHAALGAGSVSMSAQATVHTNANKILGDTARNGGVVFTTRGSTNDYSPTLVLSDHTSQRTSYFADRDSLAAGVTTAFHTVGQKHLLHGRFVRTGSGKFGGTWTLAFDGTLYTNNNLSLGAGGLGSASFAANPIIGYHPIWGHDPDIEIKFLQVTLLEHSDDYITTQYNNQNSPETFWTVGIPEATAGGASDEIITFLGIEGLTVSLNDILEPYKEVAETASLNITVTDSVNAYKEVDSASPLSISLDDSMDSYKEVTSTNSLSISMSESADSYKELAGTDALSTDTTELFTPYKELSESFALALSKLGTFTSLKEFTASIGLQCDTLGTLNKIAEITGNQGMLLNISGNFTTQIEGYSELQGIAGLTVSGVGAFNKIEEFYSLSTLSTQQSASVVSIKDMQGIIGLQNSLVGTTKKISLFNEALPLQVELVDSLNKIVRLSGSQNVTIDTYGIVYDAIDDAEKIESVVANIEGKLVVLEVSGLLSTTKITSSLSSNIKIAGKLNH